MALMSMRQYAESRKLRGLPGGTAMAVSKAAAAGRIQLINGKIDPVAADADWSRNTRTNLGDLHEPAGLPEPEPRDEAKDEPRRTGAGRRPTPGTLAHAQFVKETAKAKREVWKTQLEEGSLIEVAKVDAKWTEVATRVKEGGMALPTRIVNRLPEEWRRQVFAIATEEVHRFLTAIHHEFCPDRATA